MDQNFKFTYNDISIVPAVISEVEHRSECIPFDRNNMLPLFTAPMDSVVGYDNYSQWGKQGILTIIPRTIKLEDRLEFAKEGYWIALSLGEFKEYFVDHNDYDGSKILIDVANGHMKIIYDYVKEAKIKNMSLTVMVGNIANPETYKIAEEAGVDYLRCGIGGGRGCFVKGTLITMADGRKVPIENIRIGDKVKTHLGNSKKVYNIFHLLDEDHTIISINNNIMCTLNHRFLTNKNEWVEAKDLKVGDVLKNGIVIDSLEISDYWDNVYDLSISDDESYIANDYVVHNCTTTSNTSIHYAMASLIKETFEVKKKINGRCKIVADGGIRNYSDIIKALALGADYVMIGSVFTKMLESAAKTYFSYVSGNGEWYKFSYDPNFHKYEDGRFYDFNGETGSYDEIKLKKEFYGMASKKGQIAMNGKKTRTAEGLSTTLPVEYTMESWTENFIDYLRSAMSYTNCRTLDEFRGGPEIIVLSEGTKNSVNK